LGEAVVGILPGKAGMFPQMIATAAVIFLFVFAWLGADWATRLQFLVMALMAMALGSFFYGGFSSFDRVLLAQNWSSPSREIPFWTLFAIFFPAVTGFTQGVSMSGDLKDPSRSISLGTLWAVGVSIAIYLTVAVVFAGVLPNQELSRNYQAMERVASLAWLIHVGVIAATLSSAMASFLGAPRILQSLAQDRIFPSLRFFGHGAGTTQNPRRGVLLSGGIALATVGLGKLNVIAPVVTMFFLVSYGLLNYATFFEARGSSPAFRPTFRWYHFRLSLLGALACLAVMTVIDVMSSLIAMAILFGIYQYLKRTAGPARWADSKRSYHLQIVREHLFGIPNEPEHPRHWRPHLLAFSDDARRRKHLLRFASWMEGRAGFATVVKILFGEDSQIIHERAEAEEELRADIEEQKLNVFAKVISAPDLSIGIQTLVQSFGIGPIHANTILLNGPEQLLEQRNSHGHRQYGRYLAEAIRLGVNVVVLNAQDEKWKVVEETSPQERSIDVWWWGDATSHLMLLFAYLMTRNEEWDDARIRVLASHSTGSAEEKLEQLTQTLKDVRIEAEPELVEKASFEKVVEHSAKASVIFFPMRVRGTRLVNPLGVPFDQLLSRLPLAALVIAAEDIDLEAEPEEGDLAETAAARDAAADAERAAQKAEKEAAKAVDDAEKKLKDLRATLDKDAASPERAELQSAAREAEEKAKSAVQEAAQARAGADEAAQSLKLIERGDNPEEKG